MARKKSGTSWGQPTGFLLDLAPVDLAFLVVADPTLAEVITQPSPQYKYSCLKSDTYSALQRLIGAESLITAEGEDWRGLRKRFNKGFSPSHLHSLGPLVIEKTKVFIDRLKGKAHSGEVFALQTLSQDLTTDIITQLTIEQDFKAQLTPEGTGEKSAFGILTASRALSTLTFKIGQGLNLAGFLDPVRPSKSWFYEQVFDRKLSKIISDQFSTRPRSEKQHDDDNEETPAGYAKAITRLALSDLRPIPSLIRNTVHQIKSFLFAGQDTTATLVQWICYELSKAQFFPHHAQILEKLKLEHDAVYGSQDPFSALTALSEPGLAESLLGDKLPYTTAFIKETLRLHPPAGTARFIPELSPETPTPFLVTIDGVPNIPINGLRVYICQYLIHRHPKIWVPRRISSIRTAGSMKNTCRLSRRVVGGRLNGDQEIV